MSHMERLGAFAHFWDNEPRHLSLLGLTDDRSEEAIRELLSILGSSSAIAAELHQLLRDNDWRPQLVGAVALAFGAGDASHHDDMWAQVEAGSWVVPQLAAVLSVVDNTFTLRAKALVDKLIQGRETAQPSSEEIAGSDRLSSQSSSSMPVQGAKRHSARGPAGALERRAKTVATLMALVSQEESWIRDRLNRDDVTALMREDVDHGGEIAERWKERLLDHMRKVGRST